jgi:hypothetical protein
VDELIRLAFANRGDDEGRRLALTSERDELRGDLGRLKAHLRKADEDAGEVIAEDISAIAKRLKSLDQQLAMLTEPTDSTMLRAAVEGRIKEWREILRREHRASISFILQRVFPTGIRFDDTDLEEVAHEYPVA